MSDEPTIFVVDDDQAAVASLAALIMSIGYKVEMFVSAEAFLEVFDGSRTGCLILDIRLPGMSGLELQQTLSEMGYTIPIVMISGHADWDEHGDTISDTVACLEKPFRGEALCAAVRTALDQL